MRIELLLAGRRTVLPVLGNQVQVKSGHEHRPLLLLRFLGGHRHVVADTQVALSHERDVLSFVVHNRLFNACLGVHVGSVSDGSSQLLLVHSEPTHLPFLLLVPPLFLYLVVHGFVLVVEVRGEPSRRDILDFLFEHFANWESFLLQDKQEEHELVLPLLAVVQFFLEFSDALLQVSVLLQESLHVSRVQLHRRLHLRGLATVVARVEVSLVRLPHLLLKHLSVLPPKYFEFVLEPFDNVVSLVNFLGHGLKLVSVLCLVSLHILVVLEELGNLVFLLLQRNLRVLLRLRFLADLFVLLLQDLLHFAAHFSEDVLELGLGLGDVHEDLQVGTVLAAFVAGDHVGQLLLQMNHALETGHGILIRISGTGNDALACGS